MPVIYLHAVISHHASSSVSGGCGVPLGELSHSMCLNLLLTSLSLICARVSFFFFFALNFISELSSAPEFAADAAALLTALLTLLDPGRESSKRSSETARWPLCVTRPSAMCHCSGHSAPTNSSLCEILKRGQSYSLTKLSSILTSPHHPCNL
jgi:hypothetical protein